MPRQLTEGPLLRALTRLATPMLVSAILQNILSLVNLFWVGSLGANAVAAVAMAATILMILFPALMGLSTGTIALVARSIGGGQAEQAGYVTAQSLWLALFLGVLSGLLGWFCADGLFHLLGAESAVIRAGARYLQIALLGSVVTFVLFISTAALQGAGDTWTPLWVMAMANVLNLLLDPIFIFGVGPFAGLGVTGAAVAMVLSQVAATGMVLKILWQGPAHLRIKGLFGTLDWPMAWRILRIGLPGSGQMLSRSLMGAVMMGIVAGCGTAAVAAYGIGLRFHMIMLMPAFALGGAAATMVGQNLGAGKPARARAAAWLATGLDILVMIVATVILMTFAPGLIRVFNNESAVIQIGTQYLLITSPAYVFAALGIVLGRGLNGASDTMGPMIITLISLWGLQVPLAIWLARLFSPATQGIWWAMAAASVLHGLLIAVWFEKGKWMKKKV